MRGEPGLLTGGMERGVGRTRSGLLVPSAFDPSDIPDLVFWIDASNTTSLPEVADNTAISTWNDLSVTGAHLASSGSARPTYQVAEQNGRAVVRLDGTDDQMDSSIVPTTAVDDWTIFAVFKAASDGQNNAGTLFAAEDGDGYGFCTHSGKFAGFMPGIAFNDTTTNSDTSWHVHGLERDGGTATYYLDAATLSPTNTNTPGAPGTGFLLGDDGSTVRHFHGDVAEILIYDAPLTAGQRSQVFAYLMAKWGI